MERQYGHFLSFHSSHIISFHIYPLEPVLWGLGSYFIMLQYYFIINVLLHVDFQEGYSDNIGIIVAKIVITYDSQEIIEVGIVVLRVVL